MFEDKKNKKVNKSIKKISNENKKKLLIISVILLVVIIIVTYIYRQNKLNYNYIKQDKNNYLVYTKLSASTNEYTKEVPFVNIKSTVIDKVNEDIVLFSQDFYEAEKCSITYEYEINGIILSLILKAVDNEKEYSPLVYARTYNINLNTQEVISDEALLNYYQTTEEEVEKKIEEQFKEYYNEILEEGYMVKEECNYKCFLGWREVENYLDDVHYYIKNGNLTAYRPFIYYSIYKEEDYFKEKNFSFTIAKAPTT